MEHDHSYTLLHIKENTLTQFIFSVLIHCVRKFQIHKENNLCKRAGFISYCGSHIFFFNHLTQSWQICQNEVNNSIGCCCASKNTRVHSRRTDDKYQTTSGKDKGISHKQQRKFSLSLGLNEPFYICMTKGTDICILTTDKTV